MLFIVGMTRGGNTWLGKIFDSHTRVLYRHEPDSILRDRGFPEICEDSDVERHLAAAKAYFERVFDVRTSKAVGSFPVFPKEFHSRWAYELRRAMVVAGKGAERLGFFPRFFRDVTIPDLLRAGSGEPELVVKSIAALGRMNLFVRAFPGAKVILLVRHPCGHILSAVRSIERHRKDTVPATEDWGIYENICASRMGRDEYGLTMDAIREMDPVERLAWRWAIYNEHALRVLENRPNAVVVRYEDLCADPLPLSRRLFWFAGIDWQQRCEDFILSSSSAGAANTYDRVFRDSLHTANRWKRKLTAEQIRMILAITDRTRSGRLFADEENAAGSVAENA